MTTTTGPMTVRYLLLGSEHGDAGEVLTAAVDQHGVGGTVGRAIGGLGEAGRHAVCEEVAHVADTLLDLDISAILVHAWKKNRLLTAACQRTAAHPDSEELVELATHSIRSTYRPKVEVFVDDILVTTVDLTLSLTFVVHGLLAVVRGGHLTGLRCGTCDAAAALDCESVRVAESSWTFPIPGTIRLPDQPAAGRSDY